MRIVIYIYLGLSAIILFMGYLEAYLCVSALKKKYPNAKKINCNNKGLATLLSVMKTLMISFFPVINLAFLFYLLLYPQEYDEACEQAFLKYNRI